MYNRVLDSGEQIVNVRLPCCGLMLLVTSNKWNTQEPTVWLILLDLFIRDLNEEYVFRGFVDDSKLGEWLK